MQKIINTSASNILANVGMFGNPLVDMATYCCDPQTIKFHCPPSLVVVYTGGASHVT